MLYRILTENKNHAGIKEIVSSFFEGYTVIQATGMWRRTPERSIIIEIDSTGCLDRATVIEIATRIKDLNKQEAVMVQEIPSITSFV